MRPGSKPTELAEKRREIRGRITETGEVIAFDSLRRHRPRDDDDDGPRAA